VTTLLLDANVYDRLQADDESRTTLRGLVDRGLARVIATPMVLEELRRSPFGGIPNWFAVAVEAENVTVLGYATLGMTKLGEGEVYGEHRGESEKIPDAIIADSADALADVLVSEDRRCRERLKKISTRCTALDYDQFREWLRTSAATP
jgi:predicted nucleic acid-binding protein